MARSTSSSVKWLSEAEVKDKYPFIYDLFFTNSGYVYFRQVGLALKEKAKKS